LGCWEQKIGYQVECLVFDPQNRKTKWPRKFASFCEIIEIKFSSCKNMSKCFLLWPDLYFRMNKFNKKICGWKRSRWLPQSTTHISPILEGTLKMLCFRHHAKICMLTILFTMMATNSLGTHIIYQIKAYDMLVIMVYSIVGLVQLIYD